MTPPTHHLHISTEFIFVVFLGIAAFMTLFFVLRYCFSTNSISSDNSSNYRVNDQVSPNTSFETERPVYRQQTTTRSPLNSAQYQTYSNTYQQPPQPQPQYYQAQQPIQQTSSNGDFWKGAAAGAAAGVIADELLRNNHHRHGDDYEYDNHTTIINNTYIEEDTFVDDSGVTYQETSVSGWSDDTPVVFDNPSADDSDGGFTFDF